MSTMSVQSQYVAKAWRAGHSGAEIGKALGVTRQRVSQIVRQLGLGPHELVQDKRFGPQLKRRWDRPFWERITKTPSGCWEWTRRDGSRPKGYGIYERQGAHRLAWTLTYGPIPAGLFVCHSCDNPPCINPKHLFIGSASANIQDAARKGRMGGIGKPHGMQRLYCRRGHRLSDDPQSVDRRQGCHTCKRLYDAARRPRKSAA